MGTGGPRSELHPVEDGDGRAAPPERSGEAVLDERCRQEVGTLLDNAIDPVVMIDIADEQIVLANQAMHELVGYAQGELVGVRWSALIPERFRRAYRLERRAMLRGEVAQPFGKRREYILLRQDGKEVPVEAGLSVARGATGQLVLAFIHDITERKENERQLREYQARLVDMAFDASIAEERERRRIAADLHDRIGQSLAVAQMKIAQSRSAVTGEPRTALDEALTLVDQTIADMRTLMFDLSPPVLYDLGLTAALAWLGDTLQQKHGLHVALDARDESSGLDPDVAALLFRTVRELLMNVVKHAGSSHAWVSLRTDADSVHIVVRDSGAGFDPTKTKRSGKGTFGLFSAREQVIRLGGTLVVRSAPGKGTLVEVTVPRTSIDGDGGES